VEKIQVDMQKSENHRVSRKVQKDKITLLKNGELSLPSLGRLAARGLTKIT